MYAAFVPAECASYISVNTYKKQWGTLTTTILSNNIAKIAKQALLDNYKQNCRGFVKNVQEEILCWVGIEFQYNENRETRLIRVSLKQKEKMGRWTQLKRENFFNHTHNERLINVGLRMKEQYQLHIKNIWKNRREILKRPAHPLYSILKEFDAKLLEIENYNDENPLFTRLAEKDVLCTSLVRLWSLLEIDSLCESSPDIPLQTKYDRNFELNTRNWPNGRSKKIIKMEQKQDELKLSIQLLRNEISDTWSYATNIKSFYITVPKPSVYWRVDLFKKMHAKVLEISFIHIQKCTAQKEKHCTQMIETKNKTFLKYETISLEVEQLGSDGEELQLELRRVGMYFVKIEWDALTFTSENIDWLLNAYPTRYELNDEGKYVEADSKCPSKPDESDYYYILDDLFDIDRFYEPQRHAEERVGMWTIFR